MKKQINILTLHESINKGFDSLILKERNISKILSIDDNCYLFKYFRFCFHDSDFDVRYTKIDRDQYLTIYKFGKSKGIKGYFYKTSLLMNGKILEFIKLCENELFSK